VASEQGFGPIGAGNLAVNRAGPKSNHGRPDIVQKVTRRLIPFVGICYLIAYNDRQNVSFAKLQMVGDLGLSEYAYGLGASLFFIGYFLFEVPSNVIMEKVGARRWFARIMISRGLVTIALANTQNTVMFFTAGQRSKNSSA
jgi:sugar phosphate permease